MNEIPPTGPGQPRISDEERVRRKKAIDFARGSVRHEGVVLSPEVEEINRRFIDGELTIDEHIKEIKAVASHG
ncbi:MAG: antitoxin VbhA family protein [Pseudomonadota bacterium]